MVSNLSFCSRYTAKENKIACCAIEKFKSIQSHNRLINSVKGRMCYEAVVPNCFALRIFHVIIISGESTFVVHR